MVLKHVVLPYLLNKPLYASGVQTTPLTKEVQYTMPCTANYFKPPVITTALGFRIGGTDAPTFSCREIGNAPRLPRNRQLWFVVALACTTGEPVSLPDMLLSSKTVGTVGTWRCCRIHPESQISRLSFSACRPWPVEIQYPNAVCHTQSACLFFFFLILHFVVEYTLHAISVSFR